MRRMEERFGKKHPELEGYRPLPSTLYWLQIAFFRMHRRRDIDEGGPKPLSYTAMIDYAEKIQRLKPHLVPFFVRVIEETDNAVLEDHRRSRDSTAR